MEINAVEIGYRIRIFRENKRYSREQFCEQVGISTKFLYEIENGKKGFSAVILCRIAQVCGVSCEYIMYGVKKENPRFFEMLQAISEEDLADIETILRCVFKMKSGR